MSLRADRGGLPIIGWREWVALPGLGVAAIKVKVDTGARSSALHVFNVRTFEREGRAMVSFEIHPMQRSTRAAVSAEAEILEYRQVRSSGGHVTRRPVIVTAVELKGQSWPIELTLATRDAMGFRMLLGREAVRNRFCIDPGRSYVCGVPGIPPIQRKTKKRRNA